MQDAFNSISKHARTAERTKAYHDSRYKDITTINAIYSQPRVDNEYTMTDQAISNKKVTRPNRC